MAIEEPAIRHLYIHSLLETSRNLKKVLEKLFFFMSRKCELANIARYSATHKKNYQGVYNSWKSPGI